MVKLETFKAALDGVRKFNDYEDALNGILRKYADDAFVCGLPARNDHIWRVIAESITDDPEVVEWIIDDILYFVYDLDFGSKYKDGMIIAGDGSYIDFSTPEAVYAYITNEESYGKEKKT